MARPKVHDAALRARLLARARELLSTDGTDGVSLRVLARDCGTSTTAVYSLFGGKSELVGALLDEALRGFTGHLNAMRVDDDPIAALVRLAAAYRRAAFAAPQLFDAMFGGALPPATAHAALGQLRELVQHGVDRGPLRPDLDPTTATHTLWATVHGWVSLQRRHLLPDDVNGFENAVRAVLESWRRPLPGGSDRPELPVAGIPQPRDDERGIVEPLVDAGRDHPDRETTVP
jgi:AcrR family transcriptional regulator